MASLAPFRASYNAIAGSSRLPLLRCTCRPYATSTAMPIDARDPFVVLGVDRSAKLGDIKARYYELVKEHHPDKGGKDTPEAKETFSLIMDAYTLLRNQTARDTYLREGTGWAHGTGPKSVATTRDHRAGAAAAEDAGFHTGRRRAFNDSHRPATSQQEYAKYRERREADAQRRYAWDRGEEATVREGRTMDGTWTQYQNQKGDADANKPVYTVLAFTILSMIIILNRPRHALPANAGTEAWARSPQKAIVDRLKAEKAGQQRS